MSAALLNPSHPSVLECNRLLRDPNRLAALASSGMMGSESEESFNRLTRIAAKVLKTPLTIVSFIGGEEQFFKSFHGLPEPWASAPSIPIVNSVCQYSLHGKPLVIEDAREVPVLFGNPAIPALNLVAYLGIPLLTSDGQNLGAFCAIDYEPRKWTESEIEILRELTQSVMTEIELKVASRELRATVENLEAERELRNRFVLTLTHDLRNPLSAVMARTELLMMKKTFTEDVVRDAGTKIKSCITRADRMIQDLLDTNQVREISPDILQKTQSDLAEIAMSVAKEFNELFGERVTVSGDASVSGSWNAEGLKRVIENLVSNAMKYGDPEKTISLSVKRDGDTAEIRVHNFGNPIPDSDQTRLFEPYHRAAAARGGNQKGWGLGLTFVSGMAKAHSGEVIIKSTAEAGTTFVVKLPLRG